MLCHQIKESGTETLYVLPSFLIIISFRATHKDNGKSTRPERQDKLAPKTDQPTHPEREYSDRPKQIYSLSRQHTCTVKPAVCALLLLLLLVCVYTKPRWRSLIRSHSSFSVNCYCHLCIHPLRHRKRTRGLEWNWETLRFSRWQTETPKCPHRAIIFECYGSHACAHITNTFETRYP